jgi:hypothetical protein
MMDADQRAQLYAEYFKIAEFVQAYDAQFLSIKAWGVSVSAAAIAVGFSKDVIERGYQIEVFVVAFALAFSFWLTETRFKLLQLGHMYRYNSLEEALQKDTYIRSPDILGGFGVGRRRDDAKRRWRSVAFWPHVMFPHVIFAGLSLLLVIVAAIKALSSKP